MTASTYTLRPTVLEDGEWLFTLHRRAMGPYVEQLWGPWDDTVQQDFHDDWFSPGTAHVVLVEGHPVGVMEWRDSPGRRYVSRIEIDPGHQGHGLGRRVLEDLVAAATAEEMEVELHVFDVNPAQRLYERLGFREVSRSPSGTGHRIQLRRGLS